jgi:hypothetical protein
MCNHLNLKMLIHIFTVIYLIMIIIVISGENFVAQLDGLSSTPVCRGTPVAHHWSRVNSLELKCIKMHSECPFVSLQYEYIFP